MPIRWHAADADLLLQAIEFTARRAGFSPRLIEKDYFASVVLEYLAASDAELSFKGGTCLAKIYGTFYRMSEDLDFGISIPLGTPRQERGRSASRLKRVVADLPRHLPGLQITEPLCGANQSTQYNAVVGYESLLDSRVEPIGIEVGLREPHLTPPHQAPSRTLVLNPIDGQPLVDAFPVVCLSYREAMAEKLNSGKSYPYGFGWAIEAAAGQKVVQHGGAWQGFRTYLARYLGDDRTIVVLANLAQADPERIAGGIAAIRTPKLARPELRPIPDTEPPLTSRLRELLAKGDAKSSSRRVALGASPCPMWRGWPG